MSKFENWTIAMSIHAFTPEFFEEVAAAGIKTVEVSPRRQDLGVINWVQMKYDFEAAGIYPRSFHLPFSSKYYNIAHLDPNVAKMSVQDAKHYLDKAAFLGSRVAVIHPSSEPIADGDRALAMEHSKEGLHELADYAETLGIKIAVENLPRTCLCRDSAEMREILDSDPRLGFCFDVNHLLCDSHENMIKACGDRLVTLHISDYDFKDEQHCLPGVGYIDFGKLIPMIEATGYDNAFTYEVSLDGDDGSRRGFAFAPCTPADVYADKQTLRTVTGEGKRL